MQTTEFAGMDALLWVSMLIGMYIAYVLVVKLKYKEAVTKKGKMIFSFEYVYSFLAISVVFVGMLVSIVSWINGLGTGVDFFTEVTLGNCVAVASLAGIFVLLFQDQVRIKIDMYLKEKKNLGQVTKELINEVEKLDCLEGGKQGL